MWPEKKLKSIRQFFLLSLLFFLFSTAGIIICAVPLMADEPLFELYDPGTQFPANYAEFGNFSNTGTSNYSYLITNMNGLSAAVGEGIYPNTTIYSDPEYQRYVNEGRLNGSHWNFINTADPQADFYKWATAPEAEGTRMFFMAQALVNAGLIEHAIKAYYAIVVHFSWTPVYNPTENIYWYAGPAAIDMIVVLTRDHPDIAWRLINARIIVENENDLDLNNDIVTVSPGNFNSYPIQNRIDEVTALRNSSIVQARGTGRVQVVQYASGNWQLLVDGKPFTVKGITYSPTKVGMDANSQNTWQWLDDNTNGLIDAAFESWVDVNRNNIRDVDEMTVGDFQLMKEMGCNCIRLFHSAGADNRTYVPQDYNKELLRTLYNRYGIRVIMGDFLGAYTVGSGASWDLGTDYTNLAQRENMKNVVRAMVLDHKDEPYVLMWLLGNENNMGSAYTGINATRTNAADVPQSYAEFLNEVAQMIHTLDPDHPVAVGNMGLGLVEYYEQYAPELDIIGTNWYTGRYGLGNSYLIEAKEKINRSLIITEYGADAYHYQQGVNETEQSLYHGGNWKSITYNTALVPGYGNLLGGVVFEWLDEWWKANSLADSPSQHQTDPQFYWGIAPDQWSHEEWYGICGQGNGSNSPFLRELREAYYLYKQMWSAPITRDAVTGNIQISWESYPGISYDIFYSNDGGNWNLAQQNIPASGLGCTAWIDNGTVTGGHPGMIPIRYYRVNIHGSSLLVTVLETNSGGRITGNVILQAHSNHSGNVRFELRYPGQSTVIKTFQAQALADGSYVLEGVPAGTYDLMAKTSNCLRAKVANISVTHTELRESINFSLLGGDANNDNYVAWQDYNILRNAYGTKKGDARWDLRADFNADGFVSWQDYGILRANYGKAGQ